MPDIVLLGEAETEFREAAVWYETQKEGLGILFIEAITSQLKLVQKYPEMFPVRMSKFREAVVPVFPYVIVFIFYPNKNLILVTAIYHSSREPHKKYRKK